MAEKIIKARVWWKTDTEENWNANPLILGPGEPAWVRDGAGDVTGLKVGDGTRRFSELPYVPFEGGGGGDTDVSWGDITGDISEQTDLLGANNHLDGDNKLSAGGIVGVEVEGEGYTFLAKTQFLNLDSEYTVEPPETPGVFSEESTTGFIGVFRNSFIVDGGGGELTTNGVTISTPFKKNGEEFEGTAPARIEIAEQLGGGPQINMSTPTTGGLTYTGGGFNIAQDPTSGQLSSISGTKLSLRSTAGTGFSAGDENQGIFSARSGDLSLTRNGNVLSATNDSVRIGSMSDTQSHRKSVHLITRRNSDATQKGVGIQTMATVITGGAYPYANRIVVEENGDIFIGQEGNAAGNRLIQRGIMLPRTNSNIVVMGETTGNRLEYETPMSGTVADNVIPSTGYVRDTIVADAISALQNTIDALEARIEALENATP